MLKPALDESVSTDQDVAVSEARKRLEQKDLLRGRSKLIQIQRQGGTLILRGSLPSYYLKQVLQATLRDIEGITEIDNQVVVCWPGEATD